MATRFYLVASTAPSISPSFDAGWTSTTGAVRRMMATTQAATTEQVTSDIGATGPAYTLAGQFVSPPLAAQTITGTVTITTRGRELVSTDNVNKRARAVLVYSGDGTTLRGVLSAWAATASTTELSPTTLQGQATATNASLTSVTCQAGDVIVVEVGYGVGTSGTTPQATMEWGGTGTDHANTNADVTGSVPWVEFSADLAFQATTTPVSGDLDLRWLSFTSVAASTDLRWRSSVLVSSDLDARWLSYAAVSSDLDARWRVLGATTTPVSGDLDLRWRSAAQVSANLDARWRVSVRVTSDLDARWRVATQVTASLDARWRVSSAVTSDVDLRWRVLSSLTQVSGSTDLRWRTYQLVSADLDLRWLSLAAVSTDVDLRWRVLPGAAVVRPNTGTTARPGGGTTSRPNTGTTARTTGVTTRPFTGTTTRP